MRDPAPLLTYTIVESSRTLGAKAVAGKTNTNLAEMYQMIHVLEQEWIRNDRWLKDIVNSGKLNCFGARKMRSPENERKVNWIHGSNGKNQQSWGQ